MRLLLVNMPWAPIDLPSLALGIMKNAVATKVSGAEVDVVQANLDYVDWLAERQPFTEQDYQYFSLESYFSGFGDWVFSSALYDDPAWRVDEFRERAARSDRPDAAQKARLAGELHESAGEFVAQLVDRLLDGRPDVVGFTSTFQQNVAALAAARRIKRLAPDVVTVFGGANCDGDQGAAIHRNFPFVDYVVRGEGEASFPRLLHALGGDGRLADVDGLCWRDTDQVPVTNPMSNRPLAPAEIVDPDHDGYFERLRESKAQTWVEPKLVVEGARGCWWGEKHHCTFCGLNGSFMQFRSKSPTRFLDEIVALAERHKVLDVVVVDNIMDMGYVTTLLPRLAESGYDFRMHYEIKSNMRRPQLQALRDAGVVNVQPGIESLSTRVLKLMDKGVTGTQNVRMLRDAATVGLTVAWNFIVGFPGETEDDYLPVIAQLPALHHLMPGERGNRISIERFSPYFNRPELGFADLAAADQYPMIYDLPASELFDLAYVFSSSSQGIGEETFALLRAGLGDWADAHQGSRLSHCDLGDEVVLVNERKAFDWSVLRLDAPVEVAAFRLLDQPHGAAALARKLGVSEVDVAGLLDRWRELGIVFTDAGQYVHVVPEATNQELLRIDIVNPV